MRIGIDVRLWDETGVGRYIRNLVENLAKIDKKNSYILFSRKENLGKLSPNFEILYTDIRWHSIKEQTGFSNFLNKQNLDLVHFPYFSHPIFYNKPFIVTIHDLIINKFNTANASTLPLPLYKVKRIGYNTVISHAVKNSKKIIVPTNFVKEELLEAYSLSKEKIEVIYEGIDKSLKVNAKKNVYGKYFLYVGNAFPHKNLQKLLLAFDLFKKDYKLILVGKKDSFYNQIEEKYKEDKSILFLYDIDDSKLASLYQNAVALVQPSLMEGFGLPVVEAMANKCPIIVSDIPTFREICGDLATYFDPKDPKDIANKMEYVIMVGNEFYKNNSSELENKLKHFDWEKTAEKTLNVYESCFSLR